jgi:sugar O-acyltransferase (sialic acid O-acetyltransferase NeuD family)
MPLYLVGGGGHAKVIVQVLESKQNKLVAILDVDPAKLGKTLLDYPIIHSNDEKLPAQAQFIIAIGHNAARKQNFEVMLSRKWHGTNAIDATTNLGKHLNIGVGNVFFPYSCINSDTKIGNNVIINTHAVIEHDCSIGDHSHIAPHATLCGGVSVGEGTFIGAGATIIPGVKIGAWSIVGAGSVVLKDIPDNTTVVGNPAKQIKSLHYD